MGKFPRTGPGSKAGPTAASDVDGQRPRAAAPGLLETQGHGAQGAAGGCGVKIDRKSDGNEVFVNYRANRRFYL